MVKKKKYPIWSFFGVFMDELALLRDRLYCFANFEERRAAPYISENYSLKNQIFLLNKLGNPQLSFVSIHVAGTKGKGSVVRLIAQFILQRMSDNAKKMGTILPFSQFKVGAYYSPHLVEKRERFEINGEVCSWEELFPIFDKVLNIVEKEQIKPTIFDIFTAVSFLLFARQRVDVAVVETGLGGRLDSTNVINPLLSVIARIDYDHMDKLGKTLDKITAEKAGIVKLRVPVVYLYSDDVVHNVISETARKLHAPALAVKCDEIQDFRIFPFWMSENLALARVSTNKFFDEYFSKLKNFDDLNIYCQKMAKSQKSDFIKNNFFYPIDEQEIHQVLQDFVYAGRYQMVDRFLFDGAHIPRSLKLLVQSIKKDSSLRNLRENGVVFVFFALFDKDIEGLIAEVPQAWDFFFIALDLPFIKKEILDHTYLRCKKACEKNGRNFRSSNSLDYLLKSYQKDNRLYVVTGSFHLIGAVQKILRQ